MKTRLFILSLAIIIASCKSMSKTDKGVAIGAGAGAGVGAVIGKQYNNTAAGAIIGAVIGGTAGGLIGNYMDKQAAEIKRDLEGAKVERIGEGIKITFDSGLLFAVNSFALSDNARTNVNELSGILTKYEDTNILIEGHTDNTGSEEYNKKLSVERAESVATQLKSNNVKSSRITAVGYGEAQPIGDNTSEQGRTDNRRVEVAIFANKKLQKAAEDGLIGEK